uniref:Cytochrome b n=1 Tax=Parevania sp. ZJUH_2016024 TaxID=2491165 RepID=A0A3S8V144_9HYME|nr:cytochrome b [Parevania sp. ZJUH_2016024]
MKFSIFSLINNMIIILPSPMNLTFFWNFGSLLGMCLFIQILTGLFLSMHYCPHTSLAFQSMMNIMQNVNYGWMFRYIHLNTASLFFLCMFLHIGRNIYYNNFKSIFVWSSGILIFIISMLTAFLGYVLPWGQMSLWGATVITNLLSSIPYLGNMLVMWLWGGFSVDNDTLNRFFSLHFILPILILLMVMIHLIFLHEGGSSNPTGLESNYFKIPFHPYFFLKDLITVFILFFIIMLIILMDPNMLNDPENFIKANSMITPIHIQPEWYFLFAYAILRTIPNKLGGVIGLLMSILILFMMPFNSKSKAKTLYFYPPSKFLFWIFVNIFLLLTWLGMKEIKYPFNLMSQILSILYFSYFILGPYIPLWWEKNF